MCSISRLIMALMYKSLACVVIIHIEVKKKHYSVQETVINSLSLSLLTFRHQNTLSLSLVDFMCQYFDVGYFCCNRGTRPCYAPHSVVTVRIQFGNKQKTALCID